MPSRLSVATTTGAGTVPFRTTDDASGSAVAAHVIATEPGGVATPVSTANALPVVDAGTGLPADAAWGGTGAGTIIALLKAIFARVATSSGQVAAGVVGTPSAAVLSVQGVAGGAAVPVSATGLPLPAGAAISALQPALHGDGGALVHITNAAATQPVSGTVALAAGAAAVGTVGVTALPALPAGANTIGSTAPLAVTCSNRGGTITAGGTAQNAAPANGARRTFTIRNPASATEPLYFDVTGVATAALSFDIPPGGAFSWPAGTCPTGAISVLAATTGHAYQLVECV